MSGVEFVGDNNVRQILSSHTMLSLIKTVQLSEIGPNQYGHYEMDFEPSIYCRVAVRHTNGFFRTFWGWRGLSWYFYNPPAGTRFTVYAQTETPGPVIAYIYDQPPTPPPSGAGVQLLNEAGQVTFDGSYRYMDVAGQASGTMAPWAAGPYSFNYGPGNYAVCAMQEANHIEEWGRWDDGFGEWVDYQDWVTWWRCDPNGASAKFVNIPTDIQASAFPGNFSGQNYSALIHRV